MAKGSADIALILPKPNARHNVRNDSLKCACKKMCTGVSLQMPALADMLMPLRCFRYITDMVTDVSLRK